jgi:predicted 3-demethylubiquinone-9 3-methyltransferase (glyoxalase superfamily)
MKGITPFLWFDNNAQEAVDFYCSIFKDSRIIETTTYGEGGPGPKGSVMTISFELQRREFVVINGGPTYQLNPAFSMVVNCETQDEIDYYWEQFTKDGREVQCGWVTDKFGLSWQVVPVVLFEMLQDPDEERRERVMKAMLGMVKLDIAGLKEAYGE